MKKTHLPASCNLKYLRVIILLFTFLIWKEFAVSQDKVPITFGKVSASDFNLPQSKVIDSNTTAVIIADIGNTSFVGNMKSWVSYVYKKRTRIKIIDKKAFDAATIKVSLYRNEDDEEKLDNIEGSSYNLENGKVVETRLDKKDIFEEKTDKNHLEKKFTMPAVKEGSIIEYSYTITSDFDFNLPDWEFQNINYPCLWSEYDVSIPNLLTYIFSRRGSHPFYIDKQSEGHQNYFVGLKGDQSAFTSMDNSRSVSANVVNHKWVMKEVPDFNVGNYISTPKNYIDKIEFQLYQTYNGESTRDVRNSWKKETEELLSENEFGLAIEPDNFNSSKELEKVVEGGFNNLDKAKAIYYYIQSNFTCTDHYYPYIKTSLYDVQKNTSGTVGEINLLLIAMLRKEGIHADPVLLSTKEFGFNFPNYPILDRLNYIICRVVINEQTYYLDASRPMLGFGSLAANCYNGHARIICNKDSASIYFNPDSIKESKSTTVFIINDEKGNGLMSGSLETVPGYIESYDLRDKIKKIGEKEYFKNIQQSYGSDITIENTGVDSLQKFEEPVKIHYDFSFKPEENAEIIYYNPIIESSFKENPFKATDRKYPVEMLYPLDEIYIINMEVPAGYIVDELPKSAKVAYNINEGFFEYLIQKNDENIQLRTHIKLNKATFAADDYNSLRDFFAYIVKKQSEQIVFKKKK